MTIDYCEVEGCCQRSALRWIDHYICWGHWLLYANNKLDLRKEFNLPAIVRSDNLTGQDEGLADSTGMGNIEADKEGGSDTLTSPSTASVNWVAVKETLLF